MNIREWFVKPSTRAFLEEARKTPDYSFFDLLHGYIYGRWPHLYIGIAIGEHPWAKRLAPLAALFERWAAPSKKDAPPEEQVSFADTYHGKAVPLETATRLVTINEPVTIPDLEQVIPYKRARSLILKHPDHIVALNCPCRAARENPCLPLDVCLIVGEPFASFVMEHSPDKARWVSPEEAVNIIQAEDERGHVHHVFFKDAMLQRFYAICNCCACCCGAMQAQRNGTPMLTSSGYVAEIDESLCLGCGNCADYCQFGALAVQDGINVVNQEKCMGCGVCTSKCDFEAIFLKRDEHKGAPLEIEALMSQAAGER